MTDDMNNRPGDGQTQAVEAVETKPAANGVKPEFDFSDLSWAESIEIGKVGVLVNDAAALDDEHETLRRLDVIMAKIYDVLARTVVDIPRAWLVRKAPDSIDFSKPGEIARWLRRDRSQALIAALSAGMNGTDDPNA